MLRAVIIFSFLISFSVSLFLFFSRSTSTLRENIENAPTHTMPRLILEDFVIKKYQKSKQIAEVQSLLGEFWAPNKVIFKGDIRAWKLKGDEKQELISNKMIAFFNSKNLIELIDRSDLDTAKLTGFVEITYNEYQLKTEEVEYRDQEQKLFSTYPVQIKGNKKFFTGNNGFRLYLKEEMLDVYGKVRGWVVPQD